jgi:hypothetical protein
LDLWDRAVEVEIELGGRRRRSFAGLRFVLVLILLSAVAAGAVVSLRKGDAPVVKLEANLPAIGKETEITVEASEPKRGLSTLLVEFVQGDRTEKLAEATFEPQPAHAFWAPKTESHAIRAVVGKNSIKGLVAGEATIRVTAGHVGTWIQHPEPVIRSLTLPVRIVPPSLEVSSSMTYVAQGGCEAVVYRVGETATKHGVMARDRFFRGYDLPGGTAGEKFSIFAVPYDLAQQEEVKLWAIDDVGNDVSVSFIDKFTPRPFKTDKIEVSDNFMNEVVPKIMAATPGFVDRGSMLTNYVAINSEMRKANDVRLRELSKASAEKFYWRQPFLQMSAKVVSSFADRRTYLYQGNEIDKQDHLGFDLASTQKAPIPASNDGMVVLAEYFGIYGNAVVLDHGFGLMTLYGHMSKIDVKVGDTVKRGQTIGNTGATGLALGDHLHFTMLLHGLPVTPIEWWDAHWIKDRIAPKLGAGLGFVEE